MKLLSFLRLGALALCSFAGVHAVPSGSLINPSADSNAKALMAFLMKNYGKRALSGQQDEQWTNWVTSNIVKTPAVTGFDFMDYSPSRVAFGSSSTNTDQAIAWHNKGGIVTFCWHWGSPRGAYNSASKPWYSNFYTDATNFNVAGAMNNPGGSDYQLIVRDIDAIATQLKRLQAAGVPVLWRPLHEAEGGWFWWGARGAEPCKKLWSLLYDRLTNYHKINNLIWVWNSVNSNWFPGNNMVDIVSADIYASAGDHSNQVSTFNQLKSLTGDSKIIALTECGNIPNWSTNAPWSWWVVWGGDFITGGSYNSRSFLQSTYTSSAVLTLDEIAGWKSGGGSTPNNPSTPPSIPSNPSSGTDAPLWGQCGGSSWSGPKTCASGTCKYSNEWYSQCIP